MTALYYTLGVVLFFVAILVSIGLHELGHMIPAKKFGGKVTQYFIGFGPTVWSKKVGETEYGVKAIPLGGYVKIVGMLPPEAEELVDSVEVDEQGRQVHQGPQVQHRDVHPADLRCPGRRVGARRSRGQRPALLQDAVVEEGHRDGRRPHGEHPDRVLHLLGHLRDLRPEVRGAGAGSPGHRHRLQVRAPVHRGRARLHGRRTRCLPQPRPASARATRSRASTAPRSPAGTSSGS